MATMRRAFSGPTKPCRSAPSAPGADPCAPQGSTGNDTACGPADAHIPVTTETHRCGVGVQLQPAVDQARRILHEQGLRPYRVFIIHQERDPVDRVWRSVREREITPVKAMGLSEVDLSVSPAGTNPFGGIKIRQVSPQAFSEDDLRGWLNEAPWDSPDRTWFYEIRLHERCEGDSAARRRRFHLEGEPELKPATFEWVVRLVAASVARDRAGRDGTVSDDGQVTGVHLPKVIP